MKNNKKHYIVSVKPFSPAWFVTGAIAAILSVGLIHTLCWVLVNFC